MSNKCPTCDLGTSEYIQNAGPKDSCNWAQGLLSLCHGPLSVLKVAIGHFVFISLLVVPLCVMLRPIPGKPIQTNKNKTNKTKQTTKTNNTNKNENNKKRKKTKTTNKNNLQRIPLEGSLPAVVTSTSTSTPCGRP